MKKFVVDTSVAFKWFVPEVHSEAAAFLLDADVVLYAPDLIGPEFGNILWKKLRRGEITRSNADEILDTFKTLPLEIRASMPLPAAAFELAVEFDRTVYDSLYLALALVEDCALVTADAKFHSALAASRLASHVRWIEDAAV